MSENRTFRFLPVAEFAGMRLDQYIPTQAAELSRTMVRRIIELGGVHVGGRRIRRASHPIQAGEQVEIFLDGASLDPWRLESTDVLYRDRFLLAINKPSGIETQPTPARYRGTLYEALQVFLRDPFRPQQQPEIGMAQRLDRETSGVILFSIHPRAHRGLTEAMGGRGAKKTYLALTQGQPPAAGEIRSLLARGRADNRMKSVACGGKEAITRYRLLEGFDEASLLEVQILTGRTHQIRVHMAEAGHPILGDRRYGGPKVLRSSAIPRLMLHAWQLQLRHPVTGEDLRLEAPPAAAFSSCLEALRAGK
ncbi:MAG: RluA family pseudouridine synthase [Desulfuromonadales bacterium]|jgi:23S rRNA pseudouridine1911/1915/1917 synthase